MAAPRSLSPAFAPPATVVPSQSAPTWFPSPEQGEAISALLHFSDANILAWLTVLRSIEPTFRCRPGPGLLSPQHLKALSFLSSRSDEQIKDWLDLSRRRSGSVQSSRLSRDSNLTDSRASRTSSADCAFASTALTSYAGTPAENFDPGQKNASHEPEIQALENGIFMLNNSVPPPPRKAQDSLSKNKHRSPSIGKDGHLHWSTSRNNSRSYKTCDGFRRQENEREMRYVFMPQGPVEDSPQGPRCALCQSGKPDEDHLRHHDILKYASSAKAPLKKSRKGEFEKLLSLHKTPEAHVDRLVKEWHFIEKKKAYSCGLCIKLLTSLSQRTSHLCHDHFAKEQNMDHWDENNLIRGLLLQPEIRDVSNEMFGTDPTDPDFCFGWPSSSAVKELQCKLELARDKPYDLALAAYKIAIRLKEAPGSHQVAAVGSQFLLKSPSFDTTCATTSGIYFANPRVTNTNISQENPRKKNFSATDEELAGTSPSSAERIFTPWHTNPDFPTRTDSLAFKTDALIDTTHYGPGSLYEEQAPFEDFIQSGVEAEVGPHEDQGMYMPTTYINTHHMNVPSPPNATLPWYTQDQGANPHLGADESLASTTAPKRKLSNNTASAANIKCQTLAPMDTYSDTGNTPIDI